MAVPKEKVKARLKALFPETNLTRKRLDELSAKLAERPEDEASDEDIDKVINDFNENSLLSIEDIAKNDDRMVSLTKKAAEKKDDTPPKKEEGDDSVGASGESELLKELRALRGEFAQLKTDQQQKSIEERFKTDKRLEGVPAAMLKGRIPKDEDGFEAAVDELVADWEEVSGAVQTQKEQETLNRYTGGRNAPPAGGGGKGGAAKQATDSEVEGVVSKLL